VVRLRWVTKHVLEWLRRLGDGGVDLLEAARVVAGDLARIANGRPAVEKAYDKTTRIPAGLIWKVVKRSRLLVELERARGREVRWALAYIMTELKHGMSVDEAISLARTKLLNAQYVLTQYKKYIDEVELPAEAKAREKQLCDRELEFVNSLLFKPELLDRYIRNIAVLLDREILVPVYETKKSGKITYTKYLCKLCSNGVDVYEPEQVENPRVLLQGFQSNKSLLQRLTNDYNAVSFHKDGV
jgi:hypothetical protein